MNLCLTFTKNTSMKKFILTLILGFGSGIILNAQISGNGSFFGQAKNYGYTSGVLSYNASVPIANNTKFVTTSGHIYYIGNNNKICDYVFNGTNWQGGGQLEWDWVFANPAVPLVNDGEDIFFVGTDSKAYKTIWNGGWSSTLVDAAQVKLCDPGFPIAFGQYNGNKKIMYVCATTNKICNFYKYNNSWVYGGELNNDPNSQPVRVGTQIIFDGQNHVFFIGANTGRIHNYWWNGSGWFEGVLNGTSTPVMLGTNIQFDGNELYYIGTDARVYRMYWNAGWQTQTISPDQAWANFFVYHNNKIYYGDFAGMIDFKIRCIEKVGGNWTGTSTVITGTDKIAQWSEINVMSNPIYYEGSTTNFFYSHQVSYKSSIDGKVHYAILDFDFSSSPTALGESAPPTWHQGKLNSNAPGFSSNHTFIGYNSDPNQKMFFYPGTNGYINFFTRKVKNPATKFNMHLTFQQEFNTADPGLIQLKTDWNINWPWGSGHPYISGHSFYHNDITHNCAITNGDLTISTLQETGQGTEYGSANPANDAIPWNNSGACTPITYNYTSQQLHTGGQNSYWSGCGPWNAPGTFSQQNGLFEARLKIPRAKKAWPAFWFISNPVEIDFELPGNGKWLFCNSYANLDSNPNTMEISRMVGEAAVGYRYYDDYYTIAIKPTSGGITWYLNNEEIFSTSETNYYPANPLILFVQQIQFDHYSLWGPSWFPSGYANNEVAVYPNYLTADYVRVFANDIFEGRAQLTTLPSSNRHMKEINVVTYPNPIAKEGKLSVDLGTLYGKVNIDIQNGLGQFLKSVSFENTSTIDLDMSQNQSGLYFIKITCDNNKPVIKKVIKI